MSSIIDSITKLIEDGVGDIGRLTHILGTLESGKSLYYSDERYIQSLLTPSAIQSGIDYDAVDSSQVNTFTITTTNNIEGSKVVGYLGIVSGEAVLGSNIFRDVFDGIRDIEGGRSGHYEKKFREAKSMAISDMADEAKDNGANAVIGIKIAYEMIEENMMMVSAHGTAVKIVPE